MGETFSGCSTSCGGSCEVSAFDVIFVDEDARACEATRRILTTLPEAEVRMERPAARRKGFVVLLQGFAATLTREEAEAVIVTRRGEPNPCKQMVPYGGRP